MNVPVSEQRIRAFVFAGLREALKPYGVEFAPILREAGLTAEAVADGFAWVSLDRFALTLTLAAQATGDPCFGLKYGAAARLTSNPLGYVLANAPDLLTAIKSFSRYHRVLTPNRFKFVESAGAGRIEWSYPVTMPNVTQVSDFALMRFVWRVQCLIGANWRPIAVGLIHQEPEDIAEYEKRLGLRIAFNQPANSIAISSATLGLPLPGADAQLFNLVTRFCEEQIEHQNADDDDPLNRVREAIIRCLERGQANPRSVAEEIGVSAGSLDRRLKAQGTSFQRLLDDTRRCLAHRYLFESSLKLTDIAARWAIPSSAPSAAPPGVGSAPRHAASGAAPLASTARPRPLSRQVESRKRSSFCLSIATASARICAWSKARMRPCQSLIHSTLAASDPAVTDTVPGRIVA